MAVIDRETSQGWTQVIGLLRRWWIVLGMGTVFGIGVAALMVLGNPTAHEAHAVVLIEQPSLSLEPTLGKESLEQVVELLPTVAQMAVRDEVLRSVEEELRLGLTLTELRTHVRAAPIAQTVTLRLAVTMPDRDEATALNAAIVERLPSQLAALGTDTSTAPLSMQILQSGEVSRVGQNGARTLLLAALIGFGFSLVAAAVLDRG